MIIDHVELTDVKSYSDCTVHFTPGVNAMCGANGAGKSTVLEAIGFCLFDYLPYSQNAFIREGEKTATVTVRFTSPTDGMTYDVTRRIGKSAVYFVTDPKNNIRIAEQKQDVTDFLRQHLGISATAEIPDVYQNAIGVPQGLLTAAFLDTAARRKGVFDPLLQVDEYERSWANLRDVERYEKDTLNQLNVEIAKLEADVEHLHQLEEKAQSLTKEAGELGDHKARREAELSKVEEELTVLKGRKTRHDELTQQIRQGDAELAILNSKLEDAEKRVAEAEAARRIVTECQAGFEAYNEAHDRLQAASGAMDGFNNTERKAARLQQDIRTRKQDIERAQEELDELNQAQMQIGELDAKLDIRKQEKGRLRECREVRETLRGDFSSLQAEIGQREKQIDQLNDANSAFCPTCGQSFSEDDALTLVDKLNEEIAERGVMRGNARQAGESFGEEIEEIEARLAASSPNAEREQLLKQTVKKPEIEQRLAQLTAGIAGDQERLEELQRALTELGDVDTAFNAAQKDLVAQQRNHDQYAANVELAGKWFDALEAMNELGVDIDFTTIDISELREERDAVQFDPDVYHHYETTIIPELNTLIAGLTGSVKAIDAQLATIESEIDALELAEVNLQQSQDCKSTAQRAMDATAMIRATIKEAGPHITKSLVQVISFEADRIFGDIVQNPDMVLNWDETYEISVGHNGSARSFKQLSGGEQMAAALAVRLALLKEMSAVDVALFDEPTSNLDAQKRELLAEQLMNVKGFNQLFVISHDDTFERVADNVVRIVKTNGKSMVA